MLQVYALISRQNPLIFPAIWIPNPSHIINGAELGFPIGGMDPFWGGVESPMWALFGENVCENERIGSRKGGACTGKFCM